MADPPPDPDCVFCAIVVGDAPAHVVHSDDDTVAFLDRTPLFAGHTLVVPRRHFVTLADVPPALIAPYFLRVQQVSVAVQRGMGAAGSFVAINNTVSQSVPHLHTHVVPRNPRDGLRGFFWPRRRYRDDDEMAGAARAVRNAMIVGG